MTSNHIHLLVYDRKEDVIPKSIQLIAGRTAREYNIRKNLTGAFWEDRYHATAVHTDDHFIKCLAYIDLNMVRAGVVRHPLEWDFGGYTEIQNPKQRYSIVDRGELANLLGIKDQVRMMEVHRQWVETLRVKLKLPLEGRFLGTSRIVANNNTFGSTPISEVWMMKMSGKTSKAF